jgi:o-succinylbenzoate synthase
MSSSYKLDNTAPIEKIELHHVAMPLVEQLMTSFGGFTELRPAVLVELHMGGAVGWGECVAAWSPGYSYETIGTATHILRDYMLPAVIGKTNLEGLERFRGHSMARMAVEAAFWTVFAQLKGASFGSLLGENRKERVEVGVSIGINTIE